MDCFGCGGSFGFINSLKEKAYPNRFLPEDLREGPAVVIDASPDPMEKGLAGVGDSMSSAAQPLLSEGEEEAAVVEPNWDPKEAFKAAVLALSSFIRGSNRS